MSPCELLRHSKRELLRLLPTDSPDNWDDYMQPFAAGGKQKGLQTLSRQDLPHLQSRILDSLPVHGLVGIQIEYDPVRSVESINPSAPGVNLQCVYLN